MSDYLTTARRFVTNRETSEKSANSTLNGTAALDKSLLSLISPPREVTGSARPDDPRQDRTEDATLWSHLLDLAWDLDGHDPSGLFGTLLGLRCYGAELGELAGSLRVLRGEMTQDEYARIRTELIPFTETLKVLLKSVAAGMMHEKK